MNRIITYFPALTGVRALAAYSVYIFHTYHDQATHQPTNVLLQYINTGYIGVSVFFVLSGFLITTRYMEHVAATWPWWKKYLQNRLARIWPLYLLLTLGMFAILHFTSSYYDHFSWDEFPVKDKLVVLFTNLTLTKAFFATLQYTGIGAAWTLTTEEVFYVIAPVLLLLRVRGWKIPLAIIFFLLVGLALVWTAKQSSVYLYGFMVDVKFMLIKSFFGRATEFMCGMALAFWMRAGKPVPRYATWLGILGMFLCVTAMVVARRGADAQLLPLEHLINNFVLPLPIALFFAGLVTERTWLQSLLSTPMADKLGKSSYAFYLIHQGIYNELIARNFTSIIAVQFALLIGISWLLYKYVEHPIQQRLRAKPFANQYQLV